MAATGPTLPHPSSEAKCKGLNNFPKGKPCRNLSLGEEPTQRPQRKLWVTSGLSAPVVRTPTRHISPTRGQGRVKGGVSEPLISGGAGALQTSGSQVSVTGTGRAGERGGGCQGVLWTQQGDRGLGPNESRWAGHSGDNSAVFS